VEGFGDFLRVVGRMVFLVMEVLLTLLSIIPYSKIYNKSNSSKKPSKEFPKILSNSISPTKFTKFAMINLAQNI
jgi:hypothetical protein